MCPALSAQQWSLARGHLAAFARPGCALLLAFAAAGCSQGAPPQPPPARPPSSAKAAAKPEPARSDPACIGPLEAPLKLRSPAGALVVGVLSGLKNADDDNLDALRSLARALRERGAELLVANGDVGESSEVQVSLLGTLAATGLPVLVSPGNRELRADLDAAETELRRRGANLVDLSHTRAVDLGDALLVSLPGGFERRQVRSDGACLYVQRDCDALGQWLDKLPAGSPPVVLVAAVPPKGEGAKALDSSEGQNLGDPRLLALLTPQRAPFGLFGQVWESGGRAIDGAGRPVAQKAAATQLYLNPGAADRTPWPMSDGTTEAGLAALFTIRGRSASYEVLRAQPKATP
jgi:hypothetical protein